MKKIMKRKYQIRKNSIEKFANQMRWKGSGTRDDYYFIENGNQNPMDLTFSGVNNYIHLKGQCFTRLSLVRCQNIVIDDCTISQLHIEGCTSIHVKNSRILKIKHFLSKGNRFENDIILRESYDRLIKDGYNKLVLASMSFITIFAVFFLVISILGFISSIYLWNSIVYLISGVFAISTSFYYFQARMRIGKFPPNIYSNFTKVPFTDIRFHFAEVINLKQ